MFVRLRSKLGIFCTVVMLMSSWRTSKLAYKMWSAWTFCANTLRWATIGTKPLLALLLFLVTYTPPAMWVLTVSDVPVIITSLLTNETNSRTRHTWPCPPPLIYHIQSISITAACTALEEVCRWSEKCAGDYCNCGPYPLGSMRSMHSLSSVVWHGTDLPLQFCHH